MTSAERREARYQRRKAKREAKRLQLLETYNFERVISSDSLWKAAKASRRGVFWKVSVQRYNMNLLRNSVKMHKALESGADPRKGFICFDILERGKPRHIQSVHFSERVVQKSLCTNALLPLLTRNLIHDNGASLKDKGTGFAMDRLKVHLRRHFKEFGLNGYILQVDFKNYFGSIRHQPLYELYQKQFGEDKRLVDFAFLFVTAFGEIGLGLGSETSQINAISYPNHIDHFIKEVLKCKNYGRYNDDSYFMFQTKADAKAALKTLESMYERLGITLNRTKTGIVKISKEFNFLKAHFSISETGHIAARPSREAITRERRKLKKMLKIYLRGEMCIEDIHTSYMSWRGCITQKNAYDTVCAMNELYNELFGYYPEPKKRRNKK